MQRDTLARYEVRPDQLTFHCDPSMFAFTCTKDLVPLREFIGQDRAVRAIEFGMNMPNDGYNVFVSGMSGTGKTSMVKTYIEKIIHEKKETRVSDWCYIYNFEDTDSPRIVDIPPGKGKVLQEKVRQMLDRLKEDLRKAFSSDEYKAQRQKMIEDVRRQQQAIFERIGEEARSEGFGIQMTPSGPVLVPLVKGRPMEDEEFHNLKESEKAKIDEKQSELRTRLQTVFEKAEIIEHETAERLHKADKDIGEFTISRLFSSLMDEFGSIEKLGKYLTDLKKYTLDNLEAFKAQEENANPLAGLSVSQMLAAGRNPFLPFQVNVFVDNADAKGPPVVIETNPNFANLFGKIERRFLFGGYLSDHTMLKAGAIARANGGYLLLNAPDLLINPGVWPAFKRAIKNKEIRIEDPFEQFGLIAPQGLRPEPIPINVKFIIFGDPNLYQALSMLDEDFWEIFKVKADFDVQIARTKENMMAFAAFIAGCCEQCATKHFDPSGVCRAIEYSLRQVSDQEKLSTRFAHIKDLIEEANYWAMRDGKDTISAEHVQKAIDEKIFRHNLVDSHIQEMIDRGSIMIDVDGAVPGQVNGLSVYSLGDITFGKPSRITARTFMGKGGVVDIEREAELSGPIHRKGVMILSGYLGSKYASEYPLSLSTSICFEQSYGGVEGDSASSAELYAILSSIAGIPIFQGIAVTGSVNQNGQIQPIGGINEKIEGFFETCKAKGLTGNQGVLVPRQNLVNLMLKNKVIEAVQAGKFHVYSAATVDEGMEILTGLAAGEKGADGYPPGTVNFLVDQRLKRMAEELKHYAGDTKVDGHREKGIPMTPVPAPPGQGQES